MLSFPVFPGAHLRHAQLLSVIIQLIQLEENACTIAVMSYVADMSSDLMGYTEPIISCVLSHNTRHKTGN